MSTHLVFGRVYVRNRHLETVQLRTLEKMSVPFDVAFFVMLRQRGVKAADRADRPDGGMVLARLGIPKAALERGGGGTVCIASGRSRGLQVLRHRGS
jgi:hypothetical protein